MKEKVTIIISNYNTLHWLRVCVHQIRKHTKTPYHIIISDQSKDKYPTAAEYNGWDFITVVPIEAHSSGFGTDYILKNIPIDSEYICSMDVDTIPISDDWLITPISILNSFDLKWIGLRAEIESYYKLHYFHMGECYRIGRTEDFKLLSSNVGFAQVKTIKWEDFFDNAVKAHSWEDANYKHKKLSLPVTGRVGITLTEGEYGRVVGNLVMHFCFAFTATLHSNPIKNVGSEYLCWEEKIKTMLPDDLIKEIMGAVKYSNRLQPIQYWDGSDYVNPPIRIISTVQLSIGHKGSLPLSFMEIADKENIIITGVIHVGARIGREWLNYTENGISNISIFEPNLKHFNKLLTEAPDDVKCYRVFLGHKYKIVSDSNGITPCHGLDDIFLSKHNYNMLFIDKYTDKLSVLEGGLLMLKQIDMIYIESCDNEIPFCFNIRGFVRKKSKKVNYNQEDIIYIRKK